MTKRVLTITPTQLLDPGFHELTLKTTIKDVAGNSLNCGGATCPSPNVTPFCVPDGHLFCTDAAGTAKDSYLPNELIYAKGSLFPPSASCHPYLILSQDAITGASLADQTNDGPNAMTTTAGGLLPTSSLGKAVAPDEYSIVVDMDGDGVLGPNDRVISTCTMALLVGNPCEKGPEGIQAGWPFDEASGNITAELENSNTAVLHGNPGH